MPAERGLRDPGAVWVALAGVTVAALLLRIAAIDQSLDGDELFTYSNTVDRSLGHVVQADSENNPPLFYLLAWGAAKLGHPTLSIRLPSVLLGTALVPVVYLLGVRTVGRSAGLLGAAVVGLGPFSAFYGIEARGYAVLTFAAALSTLALLGALDSGRRGWWAVYVVASLAVIYTHYLGAFVLVAQVLWALWAHRERVRDLLVANGLVALGCAPLVPAMLGDRGDLLPDTPLSAAALVRELARLFFGHPQVPWDEVPGRVAVFAFLTIVAAGLAVAAARVVRQGRIRLAPRVTLLVLVGLASPLGFLVYSLAGPSIVLGRYLLPSLPALALIIGAFVVSLPRALAPAGAAVLLASLGVGAFAALEPDRHRPDYKAAGEYVDAAARNGDVIVDAEIGGLTAAQAFLKGGLAPASQSYLAINLRDRTQEIPRISSLSAAVGATTPGRRVFLVGRPERFERPAGLPLRPVEERDFRGVRIVSVRVYERTAAPSSLPSSRTVETIESCLRGAGLSPVPAEAPPGAVGMKLTLASGASGLVLLFSSAAEAGAAVAGVGSLLSKNGEAERRGPAVVGYFGPPADADRREIAGCLA